VCIFFSIKNYKVVHDKPFDSPLQDQFCVDRKSKMAEMFKNIKRITRSKSRKKGGGGCRGRDRMVVGFRSTYAISIYHH
jgi:hypothetical protein